MSRPLKLYIAGLVGVGAVALVLTSFVYVRGLPYTATEGFVLGMRPQLAIVQPQPGLAPSDASILGGLAFWIVLTLFAGALPVRMPRGTLVSVAIAPILAAMTLGGPVAAGWVALIGTTELRELRGRVPWYGTAANHA